MRCEFQQSYKVRSESGEIQEIHAGSVCFVHPEKAVLLLLTRIVIPVDYGDILYLPYINEDGRLAPICNNQLRAKLSQEMESGAITQDAYRLRDYSDCIKAKLEDMAATGGGVPPEEIDSEAYRFFVNELESYVSKKD